MSIFKPSVNSKDRIQISKDAMEMVEQIITEVGAELHDDLIQKLSVIKLLIDKIERSSFDPQETRESMLKMQTHFEDVVNSIRRISRQLLPVRMDDDIFEKSVETLCQNLDSPEVVRIHTSFAGLSIRLDRKVEVYLLRMIQELIHNAFRHSAAWNVWVRVVWTSSALQISVEDDGTGVKKLPDFLDRLQSKYNTLRMRAEVISARLSFKKGSRGLLAEIFYDL